MLNHSLLLMAFAARIWHCAKLIFTNVSSHLRLLFKIRLGSVQWLTSSNCGSNPPRSSLNLLRVQTFLSLSQRQISNAAFAHFDKHANWFLPSHSWLSLQTRLCGHRRDTQADPIPTFTTGTVFEPFLFVRVMTTKNV
jgi:hypothetical protein